MNIITPAVEYSTVVILACLPLRRKGAGIQKGTGCRIKSGMMGFDYSVTELIKKRMSNVEQEILNIEVLNRSLSAGAA